MTFCENCGSELAQDIAFCANCGKILNNDKNTISLLQIINHYKFIIMGIALLLITGAILLSQRSAVNGTWVSTSTWNGQPHIEITFRGNIFTIDIIEDRGDFNRHNYSDNARALFLTHRPNTGFRVRTLVESVHGDRRNALGFYPTVVHGVYLRSSEGRFSTSGNNLELRYETGEIVVLQFDVTSNTLTLYTGTAWNNFGVRLIRR